MDYISEKISRDPVTGKLYVGKKPGDDQAPDAPATNTTASGTPQPEKKGANFSLGGVEPTTGKGFLGVQPGRDPADTFSGKLANLFIPRMDKETGRLYMGTQVGRDPKRTADTASATATPATPAAGTPAAGTPSQDVKDKSAAPKLSSFGAAFKAAREARLSGKGGDTFEFGGKKYHSYQAGEKRPGAGAASAAKPAAVPAASKASAGSPQEPPLSDKELAAIQREKDIGKTGTVTLTPAQVGSRMLDDMIAGGVKRSMGRTYDDRGVIQKNPNSARFADTKVFTTTTRTPGENSTTTTRNDGKTSTRSVSGGGTTEIKLNDTRTPAEKASDEAKDKAAADAQVAAAQQRYDERQKLKKNSIPGSSNVGYSVKESIANYKEAFRAVLAEASDQKFTDYDIERQVSHGLGQKYDKNNPEHKKKADALRKYHQARGRYVNDAAKPQGATQPQAATQPQGAARPQAASQPQGTTRPQGTTQQTRDNVDSKTDRAAREQAARNSRSAQAQARYSGFGYSAKKTAGGGGSRGGGGGGGSASRATGSPTGGMNWTKTKNWAKTNLTPGKVARFGAGLTGAALTGMGAQYIANAVLTSTASKIANTDYNADVAKARGDDLASAFLKGAPEGAGWAVGGAVMDKIRGVPVKGNLARGAMVASGVAAGDYVRSKTANTPFAPLGRIAGTTLTSAGYGGGIGGKPGAAIGGAGGFGVGVGREINKIKVGDSDVGDYASRGIEAADKALGSPLTRGIRAQGAEDRAKMKAAMDKKRQQNTTVKSDSALDRVRRRDLPAGYGVLKRPQ